MGNDDIFYKRKAKNTKDLARKKANRQRSPKILIVCEGEKTEPNYLTELRDHYKLNSSAIEITGKCGSSPMSVIMHAQELYEDSKGERDPYDKIFCVIDKDTHPTYEKARDKLATFKPKDVYILINSIPCFEYWILLHFKYTTRPYDTLHGNSPANQ